MASASFLSHLVFWPWTAFMAQAWPRTKGIFSSRQVSASQCRPAAVHALAGDEEAVAEGGDGFEEGVRVGGQVAAEGDLAVAVEDAQEQGPGVQIDAGVESGVGGGLEAAHGEGLRFGVVRRGGGWVPPPSSQARAFMSIQPLQRTGQATEGSPSVLASSRVSRPLNSGVRPLRGAAVDNNLRSLLHELERFGADNDARANRRQDKMLNVTPETGELLAILVQATRAQRVLEVGTSNGYSTLWLADAVRAVAGNLITVEVSPAKAQLARHNLERAGLSGWVRQEVLDAGRFLGQQPPSQFDLLFLDSDRKQYPAWWPLLQSVLAPRGLLVVDNAVSHADEMEGFIAQVRATPGWQSVMVPVGNGEFVALKPVQ